MSANIAFFLSSRAVCIKIAKLQICQDTIISNINTASQFIINHLDRLSICFFAGADGHATEYSRRDKKKYQKMADQGNSTVASASNVEVCVGEERKGGLFRLMREHSQD